MKNLIDVGQIVNTHGLRGEVKVNPRTDSPEVFEIFKELYLNEQNCYKVQGVRYQKNCVLLKLKGIDDVDMAEKLRGSVLYAKKEIFSNLPEDTYLVADIIGLTLKDDTTVYGTIADVITTGSNDVYAVGDDNGKFIYVPAIKSVVKEINLKDGYVFVQMPKGLLD